jgi:hypothetical protein
LNILLHLEQKNAGQTDVRQQAFPLETYEDYFTISRSGHPQAEWNPGSTKAEPRFGLWYEDRVG